MRIIIAAGALKHSVPAGDAAEIIADGLHASGLACEPVLLPMADGGNGTVDAFCGHGRGERITCRVRGPLGAPVDATYGLIQNGETAIIEMAEASGIELVPTDQLNAEAASTYGTGELIADAIQRGVKRIVVGLGGSATTDGGAGCLQALGAHFSDSAGEEIAPGGGALNNITTIDINACKQLCAGIEILVACDVDNPAIGPTGAAAIYGPQKGANPDQVARLDANLDHYFQRFMPMAALMCVRCRVLVLLVLLLVD